MKESTPLPCPFCGSVVEYHEPRNSIYCEVCVFKFSSPTKEPILNWWNRRSTPAQEGGARDLREAAWQLRDAVMEYRHADGSITLDRCINACMGVDRALLSPVPVPSVPLGDDGRCRVCLGMGFVSSSIDIRQPDCQACDGTGISPKGEGNKDLTAIAAETKEGEYNSTPILEFLLKGGVIKSYGEGRRLIDCGAVKIDGCTVSSEGSRVYPEDKEVKVGKKISLKALNGEASEPSQSPSPNLPPIGAEPLEDMRERVDRDEMHQYLVAMGWKIKEPGKKIISRCYIDPETGEKYGMGCTDFCFEIAHHRAALAVSRSPARPTNRKYPVEIYLDRSTRMWYTAGESDEHGPIEDHGVRYKCSGSTPIEGSPARPEGAK